MSTDLREALNKMLLARADHKALANLTGAQYDAALEEWMVRDAEAARAARAALAEPAQPKALTDEQILDVPAGVNNGSQAFLLRFARAVIAADRASLEASQAQEAAEPRKWQPCINCSFDSSGKTTHAFGCPNDTARYGSIAERAERGLLAGWWGEPVKYQARRLLGNKNVIEPFWTDWFDCSKEQYDAYKSEPARDGCRDSEVRALYAIKEPPPAVVLPPLPNAEAYIVTLPVDVGVGMDSEDVLRWEPGLEDEPSEALFITEQMRAYARAAIKAPPAAPEAADEVQALRDALAVWEGDHCGGDCLAAPCSHCDGTCRTTGKGARLQNELDEAREELAADRASRLPEMGEGDWPELPPPTFPADERSPDLWDVGVLRHIQRTAVEAYKALVRGKT